MINVAIMGYGVVGKGTAQVLTMNAEKITRVAGEEINIKYILDLLDFPGDPFEDRIIHDFSILESDPEITIVAEVMGGVRAAYEFTRRLLSAGKSVVTSNKELVATYGDELLALAAAKGVQYMFEASVGGGIPVLAPMQDCLTANEIVEVAGIVNGTTNYILTQMKNGCDFQTALKDAQAKGFAEANPTADIEGHDACRKICILAALSFGVLISPDQVSTRGITDITPDDIRRAEQEDKVIKLIARAKKLDDGKIYLSVAPFAVHKSHPLAAVNDVFNAIMVTGNAVGDVMFYGQGAGSVPTASAVCSDIVHIAAHGKAQHQPMIWKRAPELYTDVLPVGEEDSLGTPLMPSAAF